MPHILHLIEFQMSFLLFIALAGYLLASRVNQSAVIGEILLGLVAGPSVLGIITYTDFVSSIAHLGAVVLLFVVGLEFRLEGVVRRGTFYRRLRCRRTLDSRVRPGLPLRLLLRQRRVHRNGAHGDEHRHYGERPQRNGALKTAAARAIIGAAGHFVLRRLLTLIDGSKFTRRYPEVTFIFATMLAFLYGMGAELMGLSAIVGAFIAGASLAGVTLRNGGDLYKGSEYLMVIFSSVFFVSLGILADVRTLDLRLIGFLAALTVVAIVSKLLGCGGAALLSGSRLKDSAIIGFGMAPRGEVAMIIGLIGLDNGLIRQDVYVSIILMSLPKCCIKSILRGIESSCTAGNRYA